MLINPLQDSSNQSIVQEDKMIYEANNDKIVNNIIDFLLDKHSEMLSNISSEKNKKSIENLVKEKVVNSYSNRDIDINKIVKNVMDRFFGYYILQKYIEDEEVSDIRAIEFNKIYIKKNGKWLKAIDEFEDEKEYSNFVRYCILKNGGKINNEIPVTVVSDKQNNLRIEAGIEPVNIISPNLVIRIHRPNNLKNLETLLLSGSGMINPQIYIFLIKCAISGINIIISGKGASGKTTLLRAIINKIPETVAITSNEETAELFCKHDNIIQREMVQNRTEDKNITLEKLSKQALLMSNDAIVVGELKGAEAMTFVDGISTGHSGYATVHSNSSTNTINRLITLMKRDNRAIQYTNKYLEQILGTSIELIIYMQNFKVKEITEVYYDIKKQEIIYNKLFEFVIDKIIDGKVQGYFKKINDPKYIVKNKFDINELEIKRIMEEENGN
ncbi:MAG: CpaF family protein [Clostridiales bacterium]|nr:CpaF family protein [Clostridiales bacterium]